MGTSMNDEQLHPLNGHAAFPLQWDKSKNITPPYLSQDQSPRSPADKKVLPLKELFLDDTHYNFGNLKIHWLPCDSILIESDGRPIFGPFAIRTYAHTLIYHGPNSPDFPIDHDPVFQLKIRSSGSMFGSKIKCLTAKLDCSSPGAEESYHTDLLVWLKDRVNTIRATARDNLQEGIAWTKTTEPDFFTEPENGRRLDELPQIEQRQTLRLIDDQSESDFSTEHGRRLDELPFSGSSQHPVTPMTETAKNSFKPTRGLRSEKFEQNKKRKRGSRSAEAKARRQTAYEAGSRKKKIMKLESITKSFSLTQYPDHFIHVPKDSKKVIRKYKKMKPKKGLGLEEAPKGGRLRFIPPPSIYDSDPSHPPYLALRFDKIFRKPSHEIEILNAWDDLKAAGVKFPKSDKSRSSTPALHLGIWQRYRNKPYISSDTREQTPLAIAKMDDFLSLIIKYISPRILDFLRDEFPETYKWNQKARQDILTVFGEEIKARPCLDFLGAFFTVAAKEGSSEKPHLDFTDHLNGISFVVPLGDWEGGHFCAPQLGCKIPVGHSQALAARTRLLLHYGTPVTKGRRLVLTLFCDSCLLNSANEKIPGPSTVREGA